MSNRLELAIGERTFGARQRHPVESEALLNIPGYAQFAVENAGAEFGGGLYRFHNSESASRIVVSVREFFSWRPGAIDVFAFDWLGRQYAVDGITRVSRGLEVLQLDPATGQVLRTGCDFTTFHDTELANYADDDLAIGYFQTWVNARLEAHEVESAIHWEECVGFAVPLFLGGADEVANLEISDLVVYWDLMGQLYAATRDLPHGSGVNTIAIE